MPGALWERAGRWLTFRFEAETAHRMAIEGLKTGALPLRAARRDPRLAVTVAGLSVPNPVGIAAGFDKDAEVPHAMLKTGFGFAEIGTTTPLPQPGNPKPRVFRLPESDAVINRLGFNNQGHDAAFRRLSARGGTPGIVGVNIGANKDAADRIADYITGLERFYPLASYFTVNISSPNTPGLRDLQGGEQLGELLGRIAEARIDLIAAHGEVPVFLKIAPDLTEDAIDAIVDAVRTHWIDGMIVSNTTLSRTGLARDPGQAGGLSGAPLFERSTIVLAKVREKAGPDLALIGVGGVDSAETALAKIEAGADLVQLYTGMIYRGPAIANTINTGLSRILDARGVGSIRDLQDTKTAEWAARPIPA